MAEHICVMQGNIPQHHTACQWQGSDSEDKSTSKVHGTLVYFSWSPSATEQGGLQAESIHSASCGCCWSGSSCRNKSLPPLFHFFWSREEGRLGDNHHCCWTAARGSWHCTRVGWEVQHQPQPAPWSPWEKSKQPPINQQGTSVTETSGYSSCITDPHLIIAHIQTAATQRGKEWACSQQFDPVIERMLTEGNN